MGMFGWRAFQTKFQGKEVKMEVRPLKVKEMQILLPLIKIADGTVQEKSAGGTHAQIELSLKLQSEVLPIMRDAVRNVQGLDEIVGDKVTPEMLCEEFGFFPLVMNVMKELMGISTMAAVEAKN